MKESRKEEGKEAGIGGGMKGIEMSVEDGHQKREKKGGEYSKGRTGIRKGELGSFPPPQDGAF